MTIEEKRKAEKYIDKLYVTAVKIPNKTNEGVYLSARNLIGSMGLYWYRDKHGKHHIF